MQKIERFFSLEEKQNLLKKLGKMKNIRIEKVCFLIHSSHQLIDLSLDR